ncbi:type II secretion system GspH family protein, partial [Patescibacteria group bacterium]|nr:type II secretion system GspH family protein [Patescibacteria group bacterium]
MASTKGFTSANEEDNEYFFSLFRSAAEAKPRRGFTLVELMVAVSIFAIVMMIGVGALLSLVQTNRRAQAINSVMNNL